MTPKTRNHDLTMMYPTSAHEALDFTTLTAMVASYASTNKARLALIDLKPSANRRAIEEELSQVDELLKLSEQGHRLPAVAAEAIDDAMPLLRVKDAVLPMELFMAIHAQANAYANAYRFAQKHREQAPSMAAMLRPFPPIPEIPAAIDGVFERNGQIRGNASKELKAIRFELTSRRSQGDRLFYQVMRRMDKSGWLADIRESVSNDRRVLAIKSAYKSKVNGAFHGSSAKQSLTYLEPIECLAINAEIGDLLDQEMQEIRRILKALTAEIQPFMQEIKGCDERLHALDSLHARSRFAEVEGCILPRISHDMTLDIKKGINPILRAAHQGDSTDIIPLDVQLNPSQRLLVISGPNAGGKSLALKTVGLFQMMLQSGLLIPAHPKTVLPWFDRIMVDLGDAQSVENELSTYSGKLTKVRDMMAEANAKTLCLVDEFGSGSDPELGSAMASVCMQELHLSQCLGVFTTHYNSIKALGEELEGACNANMAFDLTSFEPLFQLIMGVPGSSYTFEVAQRVGLPKRLMKEAKQILAADSLAVDRLLVGLQKQRSALDKNRTEVSKRLEDLESLKQTQDKQIQSLENKLSRASADNAAIADQLMWGKRLEQWASSWQKAKTQKARNEIKDRMVRLVSERVKATKRQVTRTETVKQQANRQALELLWSMPVKVGDKVKVVHGGRQAGEVMEVRKNKFLIQLGGVLSTWAERKDFVHWTHRNQVQLKAKPPNKKQPKP